MTDRKVLPQSDGWDTRSLEQFEQVWLKPGNGHMSRWDDHRRTLFLAQLMPDGSSVLRQLMVQQVLKRSDGTVVGVQYAIDEAIEEFFGKPLLVVLPAIEGAVQ